uniref:Uncharacterized protein n=1 Tax=Nomascus leucogenys TaxID=61853 RepID=A0A2I3HJ61_NOMLE
MNGMHTIDERGGDYCGNLTVQELFLELTPLLSLMCIPLCAFLYNHSSFNFPGKPSLSAITTSFQASSYFHHHNQYGAIIYLCTCSYV